MTAVFNRRYAYLGVAGTAAVLLIAIFSRMMNYGVRRDEQLYASPIRLLGEWNLYQDFFYNHVPGTAWFFHSIGWLLASDYLLFVARFSVFLCWILFAISLIWITARLTRSSTMVFFVLIFGLCNDLLLSNAGMAASNNFIPTSLAYLGLGLFIIGTDSRKANLMLIGLAGFCLACAASVKASAIVFIPPVAIASLLMPNHISFVERLVRVTAPLVIGGVIGSLITIGYLLADPELFLAHIVGFHTGPHTAYWFAQPEAGDTVAISFGAKIRNAYTAWLSGTNQIAVLIAVTLLVLVLRDNKTKLLASGSVVLVLFALVLSVGMSFVPTPSFLIYFAQPVLCIPLLLALMFAILSPEARKSVQPVLLAASIMMVAINLPRLAPALVNLMRPNAWTTVQTHKGGLEIKKHLSKVGLTGKVATLAPIYPLEGGLDVYPEFATGQFAYRTAPFADEELLTHYVTTSEKDVAELFEKDPPAAILVGFEPDLERPMVDYALANNYRRVPDIQLKDRYGQGVLYLKP